MDDQPEKALEYEEPAEGDDKGRDFFPDNERSHAAPEKETRGQGSEKCEGGGEIFLENEDAGDTAEEPDAASGGEVDVAREDDE